MASTLAGPLKYLTVSPIAAHTATVVFIHGLGDSGHGWKPVAEMFSADPAMQHIKWVFPHAPNMAVTANGGMVMPSWYDIYSFGGLKEEEDEEGILRSAKAIKQLIDSEISSTSIQPNRVVIGGFSQGGVMSLLTGMTMDKKLAGIVGLSCYLTLRAKFKEARFRYCILTEGLTHLR
ncbi:Phospholipase/carboxylesterase/thioesterase [Mucidula mucida]|nr:Phospholipase/carboxylesterase/thioesterase [Mucidula mucida]